MAVPRVPAHPAELPCGWGHLVDIIGPQFLAKLQLFLCVASQIRLKASKSSKVSPGREYKMVMVMWQDPGNIAKSWHLYLDLSLWFNNTAFASGFSRGHHTEVMDDLQFHFSHWICAICWVNLALGACYGSSNHLAITTNIAYTRMPIHIWIIILKSVDFILHRKYQKTITYYKFERQDCF